MTNLLIPHFENDEASLNIIKEVQKNITKLLLKSIEIQTSHKKYII